jgi:hypothetical protein
LEFGKTLPGVGSSIRLEGDFHLSIWKSNNASSVSFTIEVLSLSGTA